MIDTIVFDMDGVLSRPRRERRLALLASWSGRTPAQIDTAIFKSAFEEEAERGLWSPDAYLREIGERLGYALTCDEWIAARKVTTDPNQAVLSLARRLSSTHRIGMFTNNPLLLKRHFAEVFPEAAALFGERAVFSSELGRCKPEPEAFLQLARRLDTTPAGMFFVDDDPGYVAGARGAGLYAEVFTGDRGLLDQLAAHGITPA